MTVFFIVAIVVVIIIEFINSVREHNRYVKLMAVLDDIRLKLGNFNKK